MADVSFQQSCFIDQHSSPPESDVARATQNLMFSSSMSDEDFIKWLRSKGISDKDCKILSGKYYTKCCLLPNCEYCHCVMVQIDSL